MRAELTPPLNWQDFEDLCLAVWRFVWSDKNAQKNGRQGQPQAGVDVYGNLDSEGRADGVQCKGKKRNKPRVVLTLADVEVEVKKAASFHPHLRTFIVATTAPTDVELQEKARALTADSPLDEIHVYGWDTICDLIHLYRPLEVWYRKLSGQLGDPLGIYEILDTSGASFTDLTSRVQMNRDSLRIEIECSLEQRKGPADPGGIESEEVRIRSDQVISAATASLTSARAPATSDFRETRDRIARMHELIGHEELQQAARLKAALKASLATLPEDEVSLLTEGYLLLVEIEQRQLRRARILGEEAQTYLDELKALKEALESLQD